MKWHIAAFYNFISALTAFIGMFIGVAVGNTSLVALDWILVAVAGIFLYVALVDMVSVCQHLFSYMCVLWHIDCCWGRGGDGLPMMVVQMNGFQGLLPHCHYSTNSK